MQTLPIIIAFTPSYITPAATTLRSILDTLSKGVSLEVICLVDEPLSDNDMATLGALAKMEKGRLITFRQIPMGEKLKGLYVDERYSAVANYRLFVADLLPEWKRAIYLDCDIIVRQDLAQLYFSIDLENNYVAGVAEAATDWQTERYKALGCDPKLYINSGFLVLNLDLLRKEQVAQRFEEVLRQATYLEFPDQDTLNIVCQGRIHYLHPRYNGIRTFMLPAYRQVFLKRYTQAEWVEVAQVGNIHYTGAKPWVRYTHLFEKWWQTYWRLPQVLQTRGTNSRKVERLAKLFSLPGVRSLANFVLTIRNRNARV